MTHKRNKRDLLHDRLLIEDQPSIFRGSYELPDYIQENLKEELREYQKAALRHFHYTQGTDQSNLAFNHLLFNMATGSGKTMVLAALILYLYKEQEKQNFIFFVNADAIVKKTEENLINTKSSKYLFNPKGIVIDGEKIVIEVVDSFPKIPSNNTIYLKLTTIQKLHLDLTEYSENRLTYEDLQELEIVLLGDEAHHFNVDTKKKLSATEVKQVSWEKTVMKILALNPENRLLEFTATIDLSNKLLEEKYKNKIVYHYDLTQFMYDGYSKNVKRIHADSDDETKMMDAVLLSQYRKAIATDNNIENFKPIIMFKSNRVATSAEKKESFDLMIDSLNIQDLTLFMRERRSFLSESGTLFKAYQYHLTSNISELVYQLKNDFEPLNVLNVNGQDILDVDNATLLNTLEEVNNPIRVIFAVAKLSEGWDVLNLYDIVRISENASNSVTSTDSEVQLIGRGARYYPYSYEGESSYSRRFDNSFSDLKLLEEIHYHTINEKKYIDNLNKSIENAKLVTEDDLDDVLVLSAKVKPKFSKSKVYQEGFFYSNEVRVVENSEYDSLASYGVEEIWESRLSLIVSEVSLESSNTESNYAMNQQELQIDSRYYRKAMQKIPFYSFSNLKKFLPNIKSRKEFIESSSYLGGINLKVMIDERHDVNRLDPKVKLKIYEEFLLDSAKKIKNNYLKHKGTHRFIGVPIKAFVKDYEVILNKQNVVSQYGDRINQWPIPQDWFVYDNFIGNSLEHSFIELFSGFIDELRKRYTSVFLIRNDEKKTSFKVTEFDGVRGFMPDFIIHLSDEKYVYQVFVEPKGEHLVQKDKWKEEFLHNLVSDEIEVIGENENVRLVGIKFYTGKTDTHFHNEFTEKLLNK